MFKVADSQVKGDGSPHLMPGSALDLIWARLALNESLKNFGEELENTAGAAELRIKIKSIESEVVSLIFCASARVISKNYRQLSVKKVMLGLAQNWENFTQTTFLGGVECKQRELMEAEMLKWCNFKNPETVLSVEGIIRSCFFNPLRKMHPTAFKNNVTQNSILCPDEYDMDFFIGNVNEYLNGSVGKFDREKIMPYQHERIRMAKPNFNLDEKKWVEDIQDLRWFGPYVINTSNKVFFIAKPTNGEYSGFNLAFDFKMSGYYGHIIFFQKTQGMAGYLYQF